MPKASRQDFKHTPHFSVAPERKVPYGAAAFIHPYIYPPIPLSFWSSSFLSQTFGSAGSSVWDPCCHTESFREHKEKEKTKWGNIHTIEQQ